MTDERPIAELIGWGKRPVRMDFDFVNQNFDVVHDWCAPDGSNRSPQVDDLLAWLAGKGYCTEITYLIHAPDNRPVLATLHHNDHTETSLAAGMYPTALTALEAAVRQVAQ